ncbi:MAG: hypothetical protein IMZ61_12760, partial [Planctomycetes bacterium]|nr:hypothetical protein [Planctomycetota bacterium]
MYKGQEMPNYPGYYWNAPAVADMGKTGGPNPDLAPAGEKTLDTSSYDPLQAYHDALIKNAQAQLAEEQYQFRNPQPQVTSDYQQQQLANQQQTSQQSLAYQQAQLAAEQQWRQQQLEAEKQQRLATLS